MVKSFLVVITAETCGACKMYKQMIEKELMREIRKNNKIKVINISVENTGSLLPEKYSKLQKLVLFFPMFILTTPTSLREKTNLNVVIFNAEMKEDRITPVQSFPFSREGLLQWISTGDSQLRKTFPADYKGRVVTINTKTEEVQRTNKQRNIRRELFRATRESEIVRGFY